MIAERVSSIAKVITFRAGTLSDLKAAEAAASEAAEMEAARQERERLAGEGRTLGEQIKAAKAEHGAAVQKLESEIDGAQTRYTLGLGSRRDGITRLKKQAALLDKANCVATGATGLAEGCALIADAREARAALPAAEAEIDRFANDMPWLDDMDRLAKLRAQAPASDLIAQREALKARHDAIAYDSALWGAASQKAAGLQKLQADLARIDAQAALLPQARADLQTAQAEADRLAEKVKQLTAALGPERDWAAELGAVDKQAAAARAEQSRLRSEIEAAQSARGRLAEQLAGAQAAAEEATRLASEIAEADRRLNLLRILGNPRDGAFSKGGIPALLIERAVPELEAAANEVLETLSDGRMYLTLRTQKETSGKALSETLELMVADERSEREYSTLSGGEATRVDLAIRCGLSLLLSRRAGARVELLVLDEPPGLDERGQDDLVECLGRLSKHFATILLVTHIDRLRESLPTRLVFTKDPATGSQVEVMYQ